ncbi:MAG TPA: hypothetical protein VN643_00955 [Pyrinomonadaceae bacterium]|nr:hypothetical protein [Pyrinomonadaceae bacterium]
MQSRPNINNSSPTASLITFSGQSGDKPVAGDWNGDGLDTVGVYRDLAACSFFLSNNNSTVSISAANYCGPAPGSPLTGDWNGNGVDTIGMHRGFAPIFSLNNTNTSFTGTADIQFVFGQAGDLPVAGDWNGGNNVP